MRFLNILNVERIIKYVLLGLIVLLSVRYIPEIKLPNKELIMIGATSAIAFSILDMVSPAVKVENKVSKDDNDDSDDSDDN